MNIPANHPRRRSLEERAKIEESFRRGIVAAAGLIAHGRGEAFDYLLGERTVPEAKKQIGAAAAMLSLARHPVISVNGNATALCADEIVALGRAVPAPIEVNLFYRTARRLSLIAREFRKRGVKVLGARGPRNTKSVPGLTSRRQFVDVDGIWPADVVLVMLEDGDRAEFLKKMGKKVIAIDLNPDSRTARKADITIVDNITRALPLLSKRLKSTKRIDVAGASETLGGFDNRALLRKVRFRMASGGGKLGV